MLGNWDTGKLGHCGVGFHLETPLPHFPITTFPRTPVSPFPRSRRSPRSALTLLELLIAMSVMVMIVGTLGGLARAVQSAADYGGGHAVAIQQAQVALERITRAANEAWANENFPGFYVLEEEEGGRLYRDTLVVWHPDPEIEHADRLPLEDANRLPYCDELIVYCPHPDEPNRLVEIRSRRAEEIGDSEAQWLAAIETFKKQMCLDEAIFSSPDAPEYPACTLTERLQTSPVSDGDDAPRRAAVCFERLLRPSDEQWQDVTNIGWEELPWAQQLCFAKKGIRQAWLRIQMQLLPAEAGQSGASGQQPIPFFGSAAIYYAMHQERRGT